MGIVNVTPDSFSDGGRYADPRAAVEAGLAMVEDGADILDVGGESTRPGAQPVALEEECRRVLPVIAGLCERTGVPVSVDTTKAEVARQAMDLGACIVNDVSAAGFDRQMLPVVAHYGAGLVLMHMRGTPRTMQEAPRYDDVVGTVRDALAGYLERAAAAGVGRSSLALDPGIGFGKSKDHNLALLANLDQLAALGCPLLVGLSRKRFLGEITGRPVGERLSGGLAAIAWCLERGAAMVRVHDVAAAADAVKVFLALRQAVLPGCAAE